MSDKPKALGVHIFSGAMTLGMMKDFDVVGQYEELAGGYATAEKNLGKKLEHILAPYEEWPLDKWDGQLEVGYGNAPCACWSAVGAKLGIADPRVRFTRHYADVTLRTRPSFFVGESVPRAWSPPPRGGQGVYMEMAEQVGRAGYATTIFFTTAVLHGVPQYRQRFHFIAHKYELDLRPPPIPTMATVSTVRQAIGDLEHVPDGAVPNHVRLRLNEKDLNVIERLRPGDDWNVGYARAVADGVVARKGRFISYRLRYDAPASTVVDISCIVHPTQDRFLTTREGARLCGYPDSFVFDSQPDGAVVNAEVTQAVMPGVSAYIGHEFNRALDRAKPVDPSRVGTIDVVDFRPLATHLAPSKFKLAAVA